MAPRAERPRLRELGPGLWAVETALHEGPIRAAPLRSTLMRGERGLYLVSPVPDLHLVREELASLGSFAGLIAPSLSHHLFAGPAKETFAGVELWGPPGLRHKLPNLAVDREIDDDEPIDPAIEHVVLRGIPALHEVLFFHPESASLVVTDLVIHVRDHPHAFTRTMFRLIGAYGRPTQSWYWRLRVRYRHQLRERLERALAWPFERLVMAHGEVIEHDARAAFENALVWILEQRAPTESEAG